MADKCNGWANRSTWLIALWLGPTIDQWIEEGSVTDAEGLEEIVTELTNPPTDGLLGDMLPWSEIDWEELFESHKEGEE